MTPKQKKIAAKAEPRNKIDGKDFAVLRAEKAKNRGKGLQDEKMKPGKIMKANKGDMAGKQFFDGFSKVFKGPRDKGRVATIVGVKPGSAIGKGRKKRKRFKSLEEMRKAKGFKPGETVSQFNKRQQLAKRAVEAARATRIGKIVLPVAAAGVGAVQFLKSKMKKNKEEPKKKMGGGMMMRRPMMANKGKMADKKTSKFVERRMKLSGRLGIPLLIGAGLGKVAKEFFKKRDVGKFPAVKPNQKFLKKLKTKAPISKKMGGGMMIKKPMMMSGGLSEATQKLKAQGKMGGGMMQRPMMAMGGGMMPGYKKGKSVMAKGCKLGRKKPTKMYT